jgi:CRISPR/Cas system-associated exonuclease Cas4 (RecB family)
MVKIYENVQARDSLLDLARRFLSRRSRESIHVSDLIYLKHAYFQRKNPEIELTDDEVELFLAGRGHHSVIEMIAAMPEYREVSVEWQGIKGHIDVFQNIPIEIKTTRALKATNRITRDHPEWIEQLQFYGALTNSTRGQLWVFYIGKREEGRLAPGFEIYDVEFDDLEGIRQEMLKRKALLERALKENNPDILPSCPEWKCERCRYYDVCKNIRIEIL